MRLRIWNAFASNNSGSYVIVGSFPSEELASEFAAELREVAKAESLHQAARAEDPSPFGAFAALHGLAVNDREDQWPEFSQMEHPAVWSIGHQVFVHSDYTVTMPREIGQIMYMRGGRVRAELVGAHHPIATVFAINIPWNERENVDVPARIQDIVDALFGAVGTLRDMATHEHEPAWRGRVAGEASKFYEPDLSLGIAVKDLMAAYCAVTEACAAAGAKLHVSVAECPPHGDPFGSMRPSWPPPSPA